jgi:hypothetical protein
MSGPTCNIHRRVAMVLTLKIQLGSNTANLAIPSTETGLTYPPATRLAVLWLPQDALDLLRSSFMSPRSNRTTAQRTILF